MLLALVFLRKKFLIRWSMDALLVSCLAPASTPL